MSEVAAIDHPDENRQEIESAVVRFAGDSGDGMQLTGSHFTMTAAIEGNDLSTFPDFPQRFAPRQAPHSACRHSRSISALARS